MVHQVQQLDIVPFLESPFVVACVTTAIIASCVAFVALLLKLSTCYDKTTTTTTMMVIDAEPNKRPRQSAATATTAGTRRPLQPSPFSAFPHLRIHLFSPRRCPLRMDDTPSLRSIASCCAARARAALGIVAAGGGKIISTRRQQSFANDGGVMNDNNVLTIESSVVLMRHFERVDHVDSGWYNNLVNNKNTFSSSAAAASAAASAGYCPLDPPLSKNGIRDGKAFAAQLKKRITNRSLEDHFTLVVTSPALRCVQTAVLVASELKVPIAIDESLGDWVNRKVFGAAVTKTPELSLKLLECSGTGWDPSYWLPGQVAKHCTFHNAEDVFVANRDSLITHCAVQASLDGSLGFFGVDAFLSDFERTTITIDGGDNDGVTNSRSNNNNNNNCSRKVRFPEPEKDFAQRVTSAIESLSTPITINHASTKTSTGQKVFSGEQLVRNKTTATAAKNVPTDQHHDNSNNNKLRRHHEEYGPRLLIVTHADVVRVAAEELTPRCSAAPAARDGIAVVPGALSHLIRVGKARSGEEEEEEAATRGCGKNNNRPHYWHLASFGSRVAASLDVPTLPKLQ